MLQRYETSMRAPYRPLSLSPIASRNQRCSVKIQTAKPATMTQAAQGAPLIHWLAPKITNSRPMAVITGWREGAGTK